MLKDVMGKISDSIPQDLKEQAKDKLKEQIGSSFEAAKARFFGQPGEGAAGATAEAPPSEGATPEETQELQTSPVEANEEAQTNANALSETADESTSETDDSEHEDVA